MMNKIKTTWQGEMQFESENPTGNTLFINDGSASDKKVYTPKALMLSALGGCTGLDVASLIKKMRLEVADFNVQVDAELTEEHPKYYHKVWVTYNFYGSDLNQEKLKKIVDLSLERYCGVTAMFEKFAELIIDIKYHEN